MECWRPCLSTLGFISRIGVKKWLLFKREEQRFNQTLVIVETSSPVATAFTSLGEDAVVHGNVCLESVGLMELLQDHCCNMNGLLDHNTNQWSWPRCLIYEIFSGMKLGETEELRDTSIPKPLLPDYQRLLSSLPSRSLKDSVERDTFFRKLPTLAEQLRCQIVLNKIFPLLTSALEYGSAAAPALNALLKTGSRLSVEEFYLKVLPTIVKLFASNDRAIRVALLQHIVQYGEPLSAQVVDDQVYPHVATGFSGTSAFLRELTLKSLLLLAPKLSQRNLSGSLLKYLSKLKSLQLEQILPYCWETLQATSIFVIFSLGKGTLSAPESHTR
ncbi:hypothetical protein V6N12_063408 [Hibiscus sabdariffa]|uniref:Uncharacterized protein n=1 Tax=Hibiscus sabdariffa TaxID=183260 RepID=A0ABR2FBM4_9ROSI